MARIEGKVRLTGAAIAALLALAVGSAAAAGPPGAVSAAAATGPAQAHYTPSKTPWGDPDLRGMWPLDSLGQTPLQRPQRFGDRALLTEAEYAAVEKQAEKALGAAAREEKAGKLGMGHWAERGHALRQTSLIVEPANGRIPPLTPEGQRMAAAMRSSWTGKVFDSVSDFNSLDRCITRGMPASMIPFPYNNGVQIFQAPGYVVISLELIHETRIIPLDGRPPLPGAISTWLGSSRGHFEGSTLVIDTTNFNGEAPMVIVGPAGGGVPTSRAMHIVEHLTPTGPNTIYYEAWISDPVVLTAPWKMAFPWTRNETYKIFEYACHEGNTAIRNYIKATSPRFAALRQPSGGE